MPEDQLERFAARPAVGLGLRLAAKHREHVPIVAFVPEPIDVRRIRVRRLDQLVVVVIIGEQPMLDPVHRGAADLHRALLAEDRDRPLEIPRVREDVHFDHAERAGAELDQPDAGILGLDASRLRRGLGHHALDRSDEPLNQVDVVRCLIHDRAAVEFPGSAPRLGVVVLLRPLPANGDVRHVDAAEAPLVDRALEQLDRRIESVLLHDEQLDASFIARVHQIVRLA